MRFSSISIKDMPFIKRITCTRNIHLEWLLISEHLQLTLTRTMESSVRASFFFLAWKPTRPKMRKCYFYPDRQGQLSCVNSYLQRISTLGMTKAYILLWMYFFFGLCILRGDVLCNRKLEVETERERDEYLLKHNGNKIIFPNLFIEFDVLAIRT